MALASNKNEGLHTPEALAERQQEVAGKPQRVAELPQDAIDAESFRLIVTIRESVGVTDHSVIPGYMRTMVKHPEIFRCQMEMGTAIFKGRLSARERELAVVRIGWLLRAPYEFGEHVDIAQRYGISREEVVRVIEGSTAPGWSEHEAAILRGVEQLLASQYIDDATWAVLARSWDEAQLIEFPMMVGQYVATAFVQNSLRIRLADDNPGMSNR